MDEMDYVMHNGPDPSASRSHPPPQSGCPYMRGEQTHTTLPHPNPSLALPSSRSHYDPVHAPNNTWYSQPNPPYWHPQALPQHPTLHQPRLPMNEQYFGQVGFGGGFQTPAQGPLSTQPVHGVSDPFAAGASSMAWATYRRGEDAFRPSGRSGESVQRFTHTPRHNHQTGSGFERGNSSASAPRSLPALNMAPTPPSQPPLHHPTSTDSTSSGPRTSFTSNDSPSRASRLSTNTNASSAQNHTAAAAAATTLDLDFGGARATRRDLFTNRQPEITSMPITPPFPPATERRPIPQGRRRSINRPPSDLVDSEEDLEGVLAEEEEAHILRLESQFNAGATPFPVRMSELPEDRIRAHQLLRGAMANRRVASKSAIASLQSVEIDSLPEDERMCMICYNDFGSPTPEGINEAPLRLPKCKHVFGDHCIKKWFEESDSCPYCRDKVPSESQMRASSQAVHHFIRAQRLGQTRGGPPPPVPSGGPVSDGFAAFFESSPAFRRAAGTMVRLPERRSPPDDIDSRRRTRPRHGSFRGSPPSSIANGNNPRPASFAGQSGIQHAGAQNLFSSMSNSRYPLPPFMGPQHAGQPPMVPAGHYSSSGFHAISAPEMPAVSASEYSNPIGLMRLPTQESSLGHFPNVLNSGGNLSLGSFQNALNSGGNSQGSFPNSLNSGGNPLDSMTNPLRSGAVAPVENGAPYPGPAAVPDYPLPSLPGVRGPENPYAGFGGLGLGAPTSSPPVSAGDNWHQ